MGQELWEDVIWMVFYSLDCVGTPRRLYWRENAGGFCPIIDDDREGGGVMKTSA